MHRTSMRLQTYSAQETRRLGNQFGQFFVGGECIGLCGELGSGKTVFVQGLAEGLGITEPIHSPSFTLVNEYQGRLRLYHFDFYRLKSVEEIWALGWQDYLNQNGVIVIEWAERFPAVLPLDRIEIRFTLDQNNEQQRIMTITPIGEKYTTLLETYLKL
ncbi:MAG: tRNA (adenosine(37)-N6)-threonylcarbamoyltransferase complex ATPase subunit type 1 TsaE [bacterium]|nr:tRNA (adenosine(37)-N6)-threonylcarbamoyltransferase complex ATPase subunit type 1 TsaE [bacterium]